MAGEGHQTSDSSQLCDATDHRGRGTPLGEVNVSALRGLIGRAHVTCLSHAMGLHGARQVLIIYAMSAPGPAE